MWRWAWPCACMKTCAQRDGLRSGVCWWWARVSMVGVLHRDSLPWGSAGCLRGNNGTFTTSIDNALFAAADTSLNAGPTAPEEEEEERIAVATEPVNTAMETETPMTSLMEIDSPKTSLMENEAGMTSLEEIDSPLTSLVEREAVMASLEEMDSPVTSLVESEAIMTSLEEMDSSMTSLMESEAPMTSMVQTDIVMATLKEIHTTEEPLVEKRGRGVVCGRQSLEEMPPLSLHHGFKCVPELNVTVEEVLLVVGEQEA
ncbi:uncharacterized protein LOC118216637 isoform X2 [Anguilla anguilla]|uniref:uncharacterized protein LOC118216637 isoform X2 n=1 Tax=Anguilla anguilla TaxID=7936 RepID=UPI0015AFA1B8|nr:uncharacterized protein LOC118216637 isoform X2 [Anguilla anguilla]